MRLDLGGDKKEFALDIRHTAIQVIHTLSMINGKYTCTFMYDKATYYLLTKGLYFTITWMYFLCLIRAVSE